MMATESTRCRVERTGSIQPMDSAGGALSKAEMLPAYRRRHRCYVMPTATRLLTRTSETWSFWKRASESSCRHSSREAQPETRRGVGATHKPPVGFAQFVIRENRTGQLTRIYVLPEWQRKTIGTSLLRAGLMALSNRDAQEVFVKLEPIWGCRSPSLTNNSHQTVHGWLANPPAISPPSITK
jgi:GNAT superfamily N-acetyltransferase